jgi:hypothetical protein
MSLADWLDHGFIVEHRTSQQEIQELLALVDRDLHESETGTHSPEWKLSIAYNAVIQAAKAALAATGYRIPRSNRSHHYHTIQSLRHTVGADSSLTLKVEAVQKKRNVSEYERAGAVSDREAQDALDLAKTVCKRVRDWLQTEHPELM